MDKQNSKFTIIKGQSIVCMWPLLWVVTSLPNYYHAVGKQRPVPKKQEDHLESQHLFQFQTNQIYNHKGGK